MKAAGITLSTVGAGGGANPFLRAARAQRRRPLLRRREPVVDPRHLPQGDAAGLRPADRRGEVLPDPDLVVADPARASTAASRACSATTARPRSPPRRPSSSPRATTRSSRSGSTASGGRSPGPRTRPAAGRRAGSAGTASRRSSARWSAGRSRARRAAASRRRSWTAAGGRTCASRASTTTAPPRDFYRPRSRSSGPTSRPSTVDLSQVAPGVYESPVTSLDSGAYAVRVTQTKAGLAVARPDAGPRGADAGRVPAAGRERAAAGGDAQRDRRPGARRARPTPGSTTSRRRAGSRTCGRCCWPSRCSCGRSTSRSGASRSAGASSPTGGAWVSDRVRGRRVARRDPADRGPVRRPRTRGFRRAPARRSCARPPSARPEGAGGHAARGDADGRPTPAADAGGDRAGARADRPAAATRRLEGARRPRPPTAPSGAPRGRPPAEGDTLARLREAKRRSRG